MSAKKRLEAEKQALDLLDRSFNVQKNVLKMNKHEVLLNQLAQFFLAFEILENGNDFISQAIFKDGKGRADLLDVHNHEALEILYSESMKSFKEVKDKYPCAVIPFDAKRVVELNLRKLIKKYSLDVTD